MARETKGRAAGDRATPENNKHPGRQYTALWRFAYVIEDSRQHHAAVGNLWAQAACCILLALLRLIRGAR